LAYLKQKYFEDGYLSTMNDIEFCPAAGAITEMISRDISRYSGAALFIDYGDIGPLQHTLQVGYIYSVREDASQGRFKYREFVLTNL
jgi:SAM-dependent MidA family methyltransferase